MKNKLLLLVIGLIMTAQMIYSQVPSHVPTNGLMGYWPFNGNANDQSGNGLNGTLTGATLTSDRNGNVSSAYSFNGTSNYIKLPKITPLNDASSFTFSCWILPTGSTGTRQFVLSRGYDYSTGSFFISQEFEANSNYIRFSYNGYPNYNILSQQGYSIPYQNWQLLTVTKSATTVNLYINSVLVNSSTNTSNLMSEDEFLYIGSHWFNNQDGSFFPYYFKGLIDDVGIWNRALTSTEIQQLYTTCTTPAPTGSTTQSLCSGSTVTNLNSTGTNIKWYATRTGGTALASTTTLVNGTTYYASQTVNGCESTARMSVVVTLNNPTVSASITLTYGNEYQVINEMCPIQEITYTLSGGATGVTVVGLPYGVNVSTVGTTVTISSSFMHIPIGYYNFTITTTGGCGTSSVNGYITVMPNSPPPTLSSSIGTDNQTVCLGASIQNISYTINSGNVSVYNLPPGVNYTLNGQEIIITGTPSQAGVYNYNIFDPGNGNGCLFIPTQGTITVNPTPSAPIIGVIIQPTCTIQTGSVVLTGLPSGNWTINPGGITGSTTTATLSDLPAGAYNYTVTNASGCISSASANVIINPTVTASITHTSGNEYQVINQMCQIQEITYTLSGGATGVTVVGLPDGVNVSTVGTTVTISSSFMHIPIGHYNFTITTTGGCGTSSVNGFISVMPLSIPTLSSPIGTDNQSVCLGTSIQNISYTINMMNGGNVSIQNLPVGVNYTFNGQEIIITGTPSQAGVYNYYIFDRGNGYNCLVITTQGTITVNPTPSAPIIGDITQPTCSTSRGSVVLTGLPSGNWTINPGGITGSTTTATLPGLHGGTYTFTVMNAVGCISSASANVVINYQLLTPIAPTATATIQPTCLALGTIVVSAPLNTNYVYSIGGTYQATLSFLNLAPNTYLVTVKDILNGCVSSPTVVVVNPIPTVATPTTASVVQPTCIINGSIVIAAPLGVNIEYSNGGAYQSSTTFSNLVPNTYSITAKDISNGCVSSPLTVVINPIPFATIPTFASISPICSGDIVQVLPSVSTNGISGTWSPALNNTATTTYTFTPDPPNIGSNLIGNGDFSAGNAGFNSDYAYTINNGVNGNQGFYGVVSNASTWFTYFNNCPGNGNFLIADGSIRNESKVWEQTVNVLPNHNYVFSYNLQTIALPNPANIDIKVNGLSIGIDTAPSTICGTSTFSHVWNSGSNTTATIAIFDNVILANGNDFAIDDISFTQVAQQCSTTATMTITVIPCSPNLTCGENFFDNGGVAANYANGITAATGTTIICPNNPGNVVTVNFTSFATESGWDFLKIYDGNSSAATLLGNFSGTAIPGPFTASTTSGCLTFVFTSDATLTAAGWNANVTCAPPATCSKPNALTATAITQTSATLAWVQPANPDGSFALASQIIAVPCGGLAPTASTIGWLNAPSNPFVLRGLNAASCYEFYVRAVCSPTTSSLISVPFSFNTLITNDECIGAIIVPVNQNTNCLQTVVGSLSLATASPEANSCGATATLDDNDDVWFKFTATATSHYISLLGVNYTATPTGLSYAIYTGSCGSLTQFGGCRANSSTPPNPSLNGLTIGATYYIRVYSTGTIAVTTAFEICIGTNVGSCNSALPLCVIQPIIIPNSVGVPALPNPISPFSTTSSVVGCLGSAPSPTFFNLQIPANGNYNFFLEQNTNSTFSGTGLDVDFVAWGPFATNAEACASITTGNAPATGISCSYNFAFTENFGVNNAIAGQIYVVMVTNYNGRKGFIRITQTAGPIPTACCPFGNFAYSNTSYSKDGANPSPVFTNNATAGVFSAVPTGLSINPTTGLINLAASSLGTYVIHNSIASSGTCPGDDDTWTITITEQTSATIDYSGSPFCNSFNIGNVTLTGTGAYTGGTFSSQPVGLSINSTTGEIMLYQSAVGSYTVTYTIPASNGSSVLTTNTTVIVNPAPWAVFTYGDICGSYLTPPIISGGGTYIGGTFSSQPDGLYIDYNTGAINPSTSMPGSYTVTYTIPASGGCPSIETTENITINPIPTATISGTRTICIGDLATVFFNGTPNASVTYTVDGGAIQTIVLDNAGNATLTTSPFANCTYNLVSVSSNGTSWCYQQITETVTITVNPQPVPQITDGIICVIQASNSFSTYVLDTQLSNSMYNFVWYLDGVIINGAVNNTYEAFQTGIYSVIATNSATGCKSNLTSAIVSYSFPTATISGTRTVCIGDYATVIFNGTPFASVAYTVDGGAIQTIVLNATGTANLITPSLTTTSTYNLVSVSSNGSPSCNQPLTGTVTITVNPRPVNIAIAPSSQYICSGTAAYIDIYSNSIGTEFFWTADVNNVTGATSGYGNYISQTLTTTGTLPGTVTYIITPYNYNNVCAGEIISIQITVNPIPVVTASSSHQTICSGNTANINLSSSVVGTTFSWTADEYNVVGASSGTGSSIAQTLITLGNSRGSVTYTITPSNNGCLGVPTIATVAVNPFPTVTVPLNATYSNNAIVPASDFGSTSQGESFYWTNDNINIGLAANGSGNITSFTARNTTNAPITANITVTPSSVNGCIGNPSTYSITVLPTTTIGNISITSSNNTIGLFDTVTVDVQLTNVSDLYSLYMKLKGNLAVSQYLDYSGYTASTLLGSSADVIATDPIVTNGVYDFGITKIGNVSGYSGSGLFYTFRFVTKNIPIPAGTNFCFYLDEISAYTPAGTPSGLTNQGQYCYTFSNQTNVWPGDLNKSNTVTTADLLPIGYFYNSTGATRPNATILWTAQPAVLWGYNHSSVNGNGYKVFADSNGDGVINNADQAAIGRNMNQIHARLASPYPIQHTTQSSSALSNGDLIVTPDNAIVNALASQTVTFSVSLNNTGGLNGLYGISVNLLFDNTIFDLSTASIDYTGSIFGTAGTDCLVINHTSSSMESVGLTRYANAAINGQGLLFKVTMQTRFPFTSPLNQTLVSSYVEAANNQNGDPLVIQDAPVTNIIITNNLGVNTIKSNEFVLYPNPANEVVNLVIGTNTTEPNGLKLKVINVLGQTVEKMNIQTTSMEISTRNWGASGVYFVEITNENNSVLMTKKVIVVRK
ncbi:Secretion system C-terminal sorting domain [Flavobacteriaceae bacterium]